MKSNAEREFLDSMNDYLDNAKAVQREIDATIGRKLPVGEVRYIDIDDLMPIDRNSLFGAFMDTLPAGTEEGGISG